MKFNKNIDMKIHFKKKLKLSKSKHLLIKVSINGVVGNFILDTGASSSCVGFHSFERFGMVSKSTKITASGAGATGMFAQIANKNSLKIGKWKIDKFKMVIFDFEHVNQALLQQNEAVVDGIIGADILIKSKAIIDYSSLNLYLKEQ